MMMMMKKKMIMIMITKTMKRKTAKWRYGLYKNKPQRLILQVLQQMSSWMFAYRLQLLRHRQQ